MCGRGRNHRVAFKNMIMMMTAQAVDARSTKTKTQLTTIGRSTNGQTTADGATQLNVVEVVVAVVAVARTTKSPLRREDYGPPGKWRPTRGMVKRRCDGCSLLFVDLVRLCAVVVVVVIVGAASNS